MSIPLVSIACTVFNQENYIVKSIEGFLMQETKFDYVIVIGDDFSMDKTRDIILSYYNKYPEKFILIFQKTNVGVKQNFRDILTACKNTMSNYIALCDGDDYWTDPLKLQKQVELLEKNKKYSFVCGRFICNNILTKELKVFYDETNESEITKKNIWDDWKIQTLTVMFRPELFDIENIDKYTFFCDMHLYYILLHKCKGYYIPEIYGIQNVIPQGIYSNKNYIERQLFLYHARKDLWNFNKHDKALKQKVFHAACMVYINFSMLNENNKVNRLTLLLAILNTIGSYNDLKHFIKIFFNPNKIN